MKIFREKHECAVSSPHGRRAGGLHGLHLDPQEKGIDGNPQKVWYISPEVKGHMLMEEMTERQQHALPALPERVRTRDVRGGPNCMQKETALVVSYVLL